MYILYLIVMCLHMVEGKIKLSHVEKLELCKALSCDESVTDPVCGRRTEDGKSVYKLFKNECSLLKYGCQVGDNDAFGIINIEKCNGYSLQETLITECPECQTAERKPLCGIRTDGEGFRVRIFDNNCQLSKYNCENEVEFLATDYFICEGHKINHTLEGNKTANGYSDENIEIVDAAYGESRKSFNVRDDEMKAVPQKGKNFTNIVVVTGPMFNMQNINATVDSFFAATHVLDLPIRERQLELDENTRRRIVTRFGPIKVFEPWNRKPANVSEDDQHIPTLASCYHKCPRRCPDTYSPVCGKAGNYAREPSLMFQNHCYMDVAQCKMFWEDKSETAWSSSYIESSFLFCLGDTINGLYRFLPLIRTLQHMGRLRNKGQFKYKFRNMRFFNEMLRRDLAPMG